MMWFIGAVFFIPGATLLVVALSHVIRARRSESWPRVEATILSSRVEEDETSYRPIIRFTYSVSGKAYESDRIRLGWPLSAVKEWAESVVARYSAGSRTTAIVDPDKQSFCVLERGVHTLLIGSIVFFGAFVLVGCYAFSIALGWLHR
jgi:hypothetical protein